MRQSIYLLLVIACSVLGEMHAAPYAQIYYESVPNPYHPANQNAIDDGWYIATIQYTSHTGQRSTYTLNVLVKRLCVVEIDFGNGGYVHKDQNNNGYHYQGGGLYFTRNSYGDVISASTTVRITYDNGGWQHFDITIE